MSGVDARTRLTELVRMGVVRGASDLHAVPGAECALRIDGALEVLSGSKLEAHDVEGLAGALFDDCGKERLRATGDATISYEHEAAVIRAHAYRTRTGLALALRFLPVSVPTLESLHLPRAVERLAERPSGLILFTGPTGSGKSTALAALVDRINRTQARHVITIEDPVEYRHVSQMSIVRQREIGPDAPTFGEAVIGALRSDPDVILIGEMRDRATMQAAIAAAETGHLVMGTLHTADAAQTVDRLVGSFEGVAQDEIRIQLAQSLAAVVSTRLVPRARQPGRRCVAEVLIANDAVRAIVRDGKTHLLPNVISTNRACGMQTFESHAAEMIARNEITAEAAHAAFANA